MSSLLRTSGLAVAAAAATAAVVIGVPLAMAAPTAVPPSDTGGYLNSTARCTAPDTAVIFGSTKTSRIAVCKTASGYEYRGVRVDDGAKLIASATQTSADTYVVDNGGVKYTVTPTALSVTANGDTFRTETWIDFHGTSASTSAKPSASASSAPASKTSAAATPATPATPKATATPSSAAPLPPPLAAEAGGSSQG